MSSTADDYRFMLKEKDTIIHLIQNEVQALNGGEITTQFLEKLSHKSGVGAATLRNWFFGGTMHPRYLSIRFVLDALDLRLVVLRRNKTEVRGPRDEGKLATGVTRKPRSIEVASAVAGHA